MRQLVVVARLKTRHFHERQKGFEGELLAVLPFRRGEVGVEVGGEFGEDVNGLSEVKDVWWSFLWFVVLVCCNELVTTLTLAHENTTRRTSFSGGIPFQRSLSLLDCSLPLLTPRKPSLLDLSEPLALRIGPGERLSEFLDLDGLELGQMRIEGRPKVGVECESEEGTFRANGLVGVGKDFGKEAEDRFDVDCFRAERAVVGVSVGG